MSKQGIIIEWINKHGNKVINSKSANLIIIKALGLNSNTLLYIHSISSFLITDVQIKAFSTWFL